MIKRTSYQFSIGIGDDADREELQRLANAMREWMPDADVSCESSKTDMSIVTVEFEEVED